MELQVFNFNNNEVRTITKDNEPWWVLKDVCDVLELSNPSRVAQRLDEDEVTNFELGGLSGTVNIINESGLYSVIIRSDKPQAKPFRKWVTSEVLPTIRKTGVYSVEAQTPAQQIASAVLLANQILSQQAEELQELRPKGLFADSVCASKSSILIGELAKLIKQNGFDIGQKRLFEWLRCNGYLCTRGEDYNLPTQRAMDLEVLDIKKGIIQNADGSSRVTRTTKVTGKGQVYFVNKFLGSLA